MLYVAYSTSTIKQDGLFYLNHIKKEMNKQNKEKEIVFFDMDCIGIVGIENYLRSISLEKKEKPRFLIIKDIKEYQQNVLNIYIENDLITNIECSQHYHKEPSNPTVDAILQELGNVRHKRIVVINRSDILGKPLVNILVSKGASVLWVSKYDKKDLKQDIEKSDILITATKQNIDLSNVDFSKLEKVIDLSGDTSFSNAVTKINTVKILLENYI